MAFPACLARPKWLFLVRSSHSPFHEEEYASIAHMIIFISNLHEIIRCTLVLSRGGRKRERMEGSLTFRKSLRIIT